PVRVRAPDLRHRRRDPPRHPADRHHASVRLLRRLERDRELPRRRGVDARLRPGELVVNGQLNRLALVAVVMLAALIAATTYWQAWAAGSRGARQANAVGVVAQVGAVGG